jgi:hypothetical protein
LCRLVSHIMRDALAVIITQLIRIAYSMASPKNNSLPTEGMNVVATLITNAYRPYIVNSDVFVCCDIWSLFSDTMTIHVFKSHQIVHLILKETYCHPMLTYGSFLHYGTDWNGYSQFLLQCSLYIRLGECMILFTV